MKEAVSDVLVARAAGADRWGRTIGGSIAAHVGLVALISVLPSGWLGAVKPPPRTMEISLGGTQGARSTGMTEIGGRAVDKAVPEPKRPEPIPVTPPPKPDTMPTPAKATSKPQPPKTVQPPPPTPTPVSTKPPATGAQVTPGNTPADTGAQGVGSGLTFGGGGDNAGLTDLKDFCCQEWLQAMKDAIVRVWVSDQGGATGLATMQFTVLRSGEITDRKLVRQSGNFQLDNAAARAIRDARLPPLPPEFKSTTFTIQLTFEFKK